MNGRNLTLFLERSEKINKIIEEFESSKLDAIKLEYYESLDRELTVDELKNIPDSFVEYMYDIIES